MNIVFYTNTQPDNVVNKQLTGGATIAGEFKQDGSLTDPTILIRSATVPAGNYMHIADFERFYYITKIVNVGKELWEVTGHVDVLKTYSAAVMGSPCIVAKTAGNDFNLYLPDPNFKCQQDDKIGMVNFPNGFDMDNAHFYLTLFGMQA